MRRARAAGVLLAALVAVASAAADETAKRPPARLPTAKRGRILPSAGGVVFGRTTKAELLAKWGRPSACWTVADGCAWATRVFTRPGQYIEPDRVEAGVVPRGGFVHYLQFASRKWTKSKLRGWRTPEGIRIGSTHAALRRAYPTIRWNLGEAENRNRSNWLVQEYTFGGARYSLRFLVDRGLRAVQAGRVIRIEIQWFGPPFTCRLAGVPAQGPQGEPTGKRIHGSCSGAPRSWYADARGNVRPLLLRLEPAGRAALSSVASPYDPNCSLNGFCRARSSDWMVDVTVGFESTEAGVRVTLHQPVGYRSLGEADVRFTFP